MSSNSPNVLHYFCVDVFARRALEGNPLAVVMDTAGLSAEQMQSIAREFNLSETTFVQRRAPEVEEAEGIRVRIFTTQEELPFAGHPTLGTSSVLRLTGACGDRVKLALHVGAVPVQFENSDERSTTATMTQPDPVFGADLDPADVAPLLGLKLSDLDDTVAPAIVSTGNPFALVLVRSVEALGRLRVDHVLADEWLRARGGRWFYVLAPTGERELGFRARMQFYGGEDPATGSAAGCAISYLVARGIVPADEDILVRQGVEINRPSDLHLSATLTGDKVSNIRVGGSTVLVATGRLFLP